MYSKCVITGLLAMMAAAAVHGQEPTGGTQGMPGMNMGGISGAANDFFVMAGSDFDRPGLLPRANYSVGIGHMFRYLKKDPLGDELTLSYMYENSGSRGFLHTSFGEHTESAGVMRNFAIPGLKAITAYTWIQTGVTTFTGDNHLRNRLDSSVSLGAILHLYRHSSVWIQESYGKVVNDALVHDRRDRLRMELVNLLNCRGGLVVCSACSAAWR